MSNLLVTGGAGFIGSHFVLGHRQRRPDDHVVVLDKLTYAADPTYLAPVKDAVRIVEGDIVDVDGVARIVHNDNIDTIVNFAAESHVDRSIQDATPFLHSNVIGVQALLEVCRVAPSVRLLHVSTDEVYGDLDDDDAPSRVGDVLSPSSPYAASKAAGEMFVMAAMRTHGVRACITRCTNNFGPQQAAEKFIPTIVRRALANQPIPVYGDGRNTRDWLYVTDHCDALELVLETDWLFHDPEVGTGHVINVSANDERRNIDVVKEILRILGKPESLITFIQDRPGHDWRYALDSSAIRKLGWKPEVDFAEGLKRTVEWLKGRMGN